jgi:hypothetical protein
MQNYHKSPLERRRVNISTVSGEERLRSGVQMWPTVLHVRSDIDALPGIMNSLWAIRERFGINSTFFLDDHQSNIDCP